MLTDTLMAIGALVAALGAWWANNQRIARNAKKQGRDEAEEHARRLDHENATSIRDRARDARRMQPKDDRRGFRD